MQTNQTKSIPRSLDGIALSKSFQSRELAPVIIGAVDMSPASGRQTEVLRRRRDPQGDDRFTFAGDPAAIA